MKKVENRNQTNGEKNTDALRLFKVATACLSALEEIQDHLDSLQNEEQVIDLAIRASRIENLAWYWRGQCLLEIRLRRGIKLPGGAYCKDTAGAGLTRLASEFATKVGVKSETLWTDIKIISTFGLGKNNHPKLSRTHYRAALTAQDPVAAAKAALKKGADRGEYTAEQMRKDLAAAQAAADFDEQKSTGLALVKNQSEEETSNVVAGTFEVRLKLTAAEKTGLDWVSSRKGGSLDRAAGAAFLFYQHIHQQCQEEIAA